MVISLGNFWYFEKKKKTGRLPEIVAYKRMLQLEVQMLFEEPIELGKFLKL